MKTDSLYVLESMSCAELLDVIKLRYAIRDAEASGLDGWAMSLRVALAKKLNAKRSDGLVRARRSGARAEPGDLTQPI